jgi:DeoR/GlpR family transcriptional regulator of sugar metabolism
MLPEERRMKILEILHTQGAVKTSELSKLFSVSPFTIRNDLDILAKRGLLKRTHGGAVVNHEVVFERTHFEKASLHVKEKEKIAKKAVSLIQEHSAIFLSTGTTTLQIAKHLKGKRNLTVLTNSLVVGFELAANPNINLIIIGGTLRPYSYALVGPAAEQFLQGVYADQFFLGVTGITLQHGLTTPSLAEASVLQQMIKAASETIVVADHSKFGKVAHAKIADIDQVDLIIVDAGIKPAILEELREHVEVIVV